MGVINYKESQTVPKSWNAGSLLILNHQHGGVGRASGAVLTKHWQLPTPSPFAAEPLNPINLKAYKP